MVEGSSPSGGTQQSDPKDGCSPYPGGLTAAEGGGESQAEVIPLLL
ncbi:MAG: hypothetical protein P8048_10015 [Calditrichia bacterium]